MTKTKKAGRPLTAQHKHSTVVMTRGTEQDDHLARLVSGDLPVAVVVRHVPNVQPAVKKPTVPSAVQLPLPLVSFLEKRNLKYLRLQVQSVVTITCHLKDLLALKDLLDLMAISSLLTHSTRRL